MRQRRIGSLLLVTLALTLTHGSGCDALKKYFNKKNKKAKQAEAKRYIRDLGALSKRIEAAGKRFGEAYQASGGDATKLKAARTRMLADFKSCERDYANLAHPNNANARVLKAAVDTYMKVEADVVGRLGSLVDIAMNAKLPPPQRQKKSMAVVQEVTRMEEKAVLDVQAAQQAYASKYDLILTP